MPLQTHTIPPYNTTLYANGPCPIGIISSLPDSIQFDVFYNTSPPLNWSHPVCRELFKYLSCQYSDAIAELRAMKITLRIMKSAAKRGSKSRADQATLLQKELVVTCREIDELRYIVQQKDAELVSVNNVLHAEKIKRAQDVAILQLEIERLTKKHKKTKDECKDAKGRLARHENRNAPNNTTFNKDRQTIKDEEAARSGQVMSDNHHIGPPMGHAGHNRAMEISDRIEHSVVRCPYCNSDELTFSEYASKCIRDFCGNTREMSCVLHTGHTMMCSRGHTITPQFPGIDGTSLGYTALRDILVYSTRRAVDSDISYYFWELYGEHIANNTIWNARKALSHIPSPSMQYIIEELRKAKFLQLDESVYRYHNATIYVWVICSDTATLILPLLGRGANDTYPYVKDLLDKPIVVDGYVAYFSLFNIIQRCWSHILCEAEEVCTTHKDNPNYKDLYHHLKNIFRKAKRIAKKTAPYGGADMETCNTLANEVKVLAAGYGNLAFAGTLDNAADSLFTFLRYPGMPPTNNNAELDVRDWIIPQRNIRRKFMSEKGMAVFAVLQSFAATCRKLNLSVGKSLMKIFDAPLHNIFDDANIPPTRWGLSHLLGGRPVLPMPVATPELPETITIPNARDTPKASLSVVSGDTSCVIPALPHSTPPQNTTVIAPVSAQESNNTSHTEPIHNAHTVTLVHTTETSRMIPTKTCHISYDTRPGFVVPYTHVQVQAIPYGYDDYLQFQHKPPPLI